MTRGEIRWWVAVGDRGQPPDKSLRRNLSATPQMGSTKGFLNLEFGRREERLETRRDSIGIRSLIRISILEIGED
ncbi:hypothetical protein AVEN_27569-1 [Araneus ventricosus]|uniref:Uncharacterized protein n=1 Tax=Araneus ventricosus TaxID=182803 RepID=A0A4Y2QTG7_ARAVE|nr:hypothetical protein AVEN_27569-1 [Araneus ventricosus]